MDHALHDPAEMILAGIESAIDDVRDGLRFIARGMQMLSALPDTGISAEDAARAAELTHEVCEVLPSPAKPRSTPADMASKAGNAPSDSADPGDGKDKLRDWVLEVVAGFPGEFTPAEVRAALRQVPGFEPRAYHDFGKSVHNALGSLATSGEIKRLSRGIYTTAHRHRSQQDETADSSAPRTSGAEDRNKEGMNAHRRRQKAA
ncbi:hypothetical protein CTZ27_17860 [Streptomyces griseocarneus]|nr:hypothetical protein CTZ27_17860 [Streptomyces griseocarneus]